MPVFSVNTRCLFMVYFFGLFSFIFCFIPAHLFVLLCKVAIMVALRNPFFLKDKADIYEGFGCVPVHKMNLYVCLSYLIFENVCVLFVLSSADEIMFQMEK